MNNVEKLISENKKLIELEAARYATNLPLITVQVEAYKLAREAAKTYNPVSGNKFSTHLVNSLKKLSRLSTKYGTGMMRTPENVQFNLNKIQKLEKDLEHTLGRTATLDELAQHSGLSQKAVLNALKSKKIATGISSLFESPALLHSHNDEWVRFVYHDLSDKDKLIFEHRTGFGGKPVLSNGEIAKKLNLSQSTISNRIKVIEQTISKGWKQ
jgi:DNA-directed RNA polymerase specialized sigma subunit